MSIVVVAYDMARELPRTLATLSPAMQKGIDGHEYEVIVVDNGSPDRVDKAMLQTAGVDARLIRLDSAAASPARAANEGVAAATGELIGLIIDGARMASPGLLATALTAHRVADEVVVATLGWHLGSHPHGTDAAVHHDQTAEDHLLSEVDWQEDGYRLFEMSCLASSSGRGWFGPMGETSALFLDADQWSALGGLDEAFDLPGGGLLNHDLYRRACALEATTLVVLLGEGTFHQFHGGAATSGALTWDEMHAQYEHLRGIPYRPPDKRPLYVGAIPPSALDHVLQSASMAIARRTKLAHGR